MPFDAFYLQNGASGGQCLTIYKMFKSVSFQADCVAFGQKNWDGKIAKFHLTPKTGTELSVPVIQVLQSVELLSTESKSLG